MANTTWQDGLRRLFRRVDATGESVTGGFPHYGDPTTGQWITSPGRDWTGGFWNGMCWLAAHSTGEAHYRRWAQQWTERLRPRAPSDTIFRGVLFYYGALLGAVLLADALARLVALEGAKGLATSFNPRAGVLPLGTEAEEASDVGRGESSIDGVQGAALLVWAARETGDSSLHEMAMRHAHRHLEFCIREDGSVCQSASFDPQTGHMLRRYTHKGIRDDSTWTRAQAWAMVGYAVMYLWTQAREFLEVATHTADWWLAHAPADRVAFWDFDAPAGPDTPRNTSGTAIAAGALLKLAALAPEEAQRARYQDAAEATVTALVQRYLDERGILSHGCYNQQINLATQHELIWGSYYLFEALHVLSGALPPARI
jgi:unsaturated chondroitin disaccharide hydrolase